MGALIVTIFVLSLIGSLHCAGMCGAFVAFAAGTAPGEGPPRAALVAAYNLGRLITYTLLGIVCGALGSAIDWGGAMLGLSRAAAILAGTMMIGFGIVAILRVRGVRIGAATAPRWLQRIIGTGQTMAMGLSPLPRALTIGLLTTLLPCGWLYAFAITAAGTGSPWWGGLTMAAFWAGTLPVLAALGLGVGKLTGALGARMPIITAVAIVIAGLYTIVGRLTVDPGAMAAMQPVVRIDAGAPEHADHQRSNRIHCPVCD